MDGIPPQPCNGAAKGRVVRLWDMESNLSQAAAMRDARRPGGRQPRGPAPGATPPGSSAGAASTGAASGGAASTGAASTGAASTGGVSGGGVSGGGAFADGASADGAVTELYEAHALGMIRLAHIMLGDRQSAEDVVQDAFCGLYRRWPNLADPASAVHYVRSAVLNRCRSVLRRRTSSSAPHDLTGRSAVVGSAESTVLTGEERREVMAALRRLPARQREALVLRFYLDLSAEDAAITMGISASSVRSATHRALAALGRMLQETS
jgi:RNA polymerase sigma-70 factor (sigma-E family)